MRFLRKAQSFRSPYLLRTLYRFVLASLNSNRPRFSHTSEKYGLQLVAMKLSLKPAGRQTLHTQWFQLSPSLGDAVQGRFVAPWSVHLRPFVIAKRYVCVQRYRLGPFFASTSRHLPTRQTLRVCNQRVSCFRCFAHVVDLDPSRATKRYARNGFCVFH